MLFNSVHFLVFFALVTALYYNVPIRFRWVLLLISSCYFYALFLPFYTVVLAFVTFVAYLAGLSFEKSGAAGKRTGLYWAVGLLVLTLAFFKYYNFAREYLDGFADLFIKHTSLPTLAILLPVGLSFHTFQLISYCVEVYRKNQKAERNLGVFALYVFFFPQVVAGPIERPQNLLPQLRAERKFRIDDFRAGLMLMAFGYFKKVVIADRIAIAVDGSFGNISAQSGATLLIAVLLYSFQLYCDFSAYSEIAVGSARILGIKLTDNFKAPYLSKSITEFWTKWHISLSSWLRDYLFLPIAYKVLRILKKPVIRLKPEVWSYVAATLLTMFIAGLWHGDTINFAVWGLLHGIFLVSAFAKGRVYKKYKIRFNRKPLFVFFQKPIVFLLVSFSWIFFRSPSIDSALTVISKIFSPTLLSVPHFALNGAEMIFSAILIVLLMLKEKYSLDIVIKNNLRYYLSLISLIAFCYFFGVFSQKQFIYFQF